MVQKSFQQVWGLGIPIVNNYNYRSMLNIGLVCFLLHEAKKDMKQKATIAEKMIGLLCCIV